MKYQLTLIISMLTLALQALASPAHKPPSSSSLEVKNLADFAQLYGYVRFFHPSDEVQQIEWTRFVVHGVSKVMSLN